MRGVNAAVVGLLGAALYNPVWTSSVKTPGISELPLSALSCSASGARRRWLSSSSARSEGSPSRRLMAG